MFNQENILRAEIDRLEAEVLLLRIEVDELKEKIIQIVDKCENKQSEYANKSELRSHQTRIYS